MSVRDETLPCAVAWGSLYVAFAKADSLWIAALIKNYCAEVPSFEQRRLMKGERRLQSVLSWLTFFSGASTISGEIATTIPRRG
jgi:hypothetical protein